MSASRNESHAGSNRDDAPAVRSSSKAADSATRVPTTPPSAERTPMRARTGSAADRPSSRSARTSSTASRTACSAASNCASMTMSSNSSSGSCLTHRSYRRHSGTSSRAHLSGRWVPPSCLLGLSSCLESQPPRGRVLRAGSLVDCSAWPRAVDGRLRSTSAVTQPVSCAVSGVTVQTGATWVNCSPTAANRDVLTPRAPLAPRCRCRLARGYPRRTRWIAWAWCG